MVTNENTLRKHINGDYLTQINEVWRKGEEYQPFQKGDNIQGKKHCETVEKNLSMLIPDEKMGKLKQIDLFILSAAACLHDIGKAVEDDFNGSRSDHGVRSKDFIINKYEQLGLNRAQAIAVGLVVSVHGNGEFETLPTDPFPIGCEKVNIIELAAIFRLADMLDTTCLRAPEILNEIKYPDGDVPSKWKGRQSIIGWYLDEKNRIILQSMPKDDEIDSAYKLRAMMNEDLAKISPILKVYGYPSEMGGLKVGSAFLESDLKERAIVQRPFPGMAFYTKEEANLFRGRDDEIDNLLSIVSSWPITILVGESGTGKTSLIHAGLFPKVEAMLWKFVWTRPFDNPTEYIKNMIWSSFFKGKINSTKCLLDVMKEAADACRPHKLLIIMDQFEDVLNCTTQKTLDELSYCLMVVQAATVIPNVRVLISYRDDAAVKLNKRLLKNITGSAQQFPSVELERLTRDGATDALLVGLKNARIGLDPRRDEGQKELKDIILDDVQKMDDRVYPPYIQMVAETLCKAIDQNTPLITREMYFNQFKSAENIIASYLIEQLSQFENQKDKAERILISLTSSMGSKSKKNIFELCQETEIEFNEMKEILDKMVDIRIARKVQDNEFEVIHDYLAKLVDDNLVVKEERDIKYLVEQLNFYYLNYKNQVNPILYQPFMASLYLNRKKIKITEEKFPLIVSTCLLNNGLGWYWLKNLNRKALCTLLKDHFYHEFEDVRSNAARMFLKIIKPEDKKQIFEMLTDENIEVQKIAKKLFLKTSSNEDKIKIIEMIDCEDDEVRGLAIRSFLNVATVEDESKIIKLLGDSDEDIRKLAKKTLSRVFTPDRRDKLMNMFEKNCVEYPQNCMQSLLEVAVNDDREKMLEILNDKNFAYVVIAKKSLLQMATIDDRDQIIEMFGDENVEVKVDAKKAFLKIATSEDQEQINEMFSDDNIDIQIMARQTFLKMATSKDLEKVIELVRNEDYIWGENVNFSLGDTSYSISIRLISSLLASTEFVRIIEPEHKDMLIDMLQDKDEKLVEAAIEAFVKIATSEDKERILEMLNDGSVGVKIAASKALLKIGTDFDKEYVLDYLASKSQGWGVNEKKLFMLLSKIDEKLYFPTFDE